MGVCILQSCTRFDIQPDDAIQLRRWRETQIVTRAITVLVSMW